MISKYLPEINGALSAENGLISQTFKKMRVDGMDFNPDVKTAFMLKSENPQREFLHP